jgi:mRNA interferase MazF
MSKKEYPRRGDVYWVNLDPTVGTEINKTRPAVIVSNDVGNQVGQRVIAAPITSTITHVYPFEAKVTINGKEGKALLDQVRSIDKKRLLKKLGVLNSDTMAQIDKALKIALGIS